MIRDLYSQINNLYVFNKLFSLKQFINRIFDYPLTINLLITSDCNLECKICSAKKMMEEKKQLKTREIIDFINKIARFNPVIFIGGGEPFMRDDIFDIFKAIKRNNLRFGVVTNGLLLDQKKIDMLLTAQPQVMIFSVYGPPALHESIVQEKGAFQRLSRNIKYLSETRKNMRLILNCVINEENYHSLEEMVSYGKQFGVDFLRFEHLIFLNNKEYSKHKEFSLKIFPKYNCDLATYIKEIDNAEIGRTLEKTIPYLVKKYRKFVLFKPYLKSQELSSWYEKDFFLNRRCLFVQHSLFIKPNGDIVPCQFFNNFVLGNILKDDLIQVWRSMERKSFSKRLGKRILPGCKRCCKL